MFAIIDYHSSRVVRDEEGSFVASEDEAALTILCDAMNAAEPESEERGNTLRFFIRPDVNL
jgi:hypothetical protein